MEVSNMAKGVTFDYSKTSLFISADEVELMKKLVGDAKEVLVSKTGAGNPYIFLTPSACF